MPPGQYCGKAFGGLYGVFVTVLGAVLCLAQVITDVKWQAGLQWFFCVLYGVGILGICYIFISPMRKSENTDPTAGSVYLKIGAIVFSLGVVISCGINIAVAVEEIKNLQPESTGKDVISFAVTSGLQIVFTVLLIALLMSKSMICIEKQKSFANILVMHLLATCLCQWFHVLVDETVAALNEAAEHPSQTTENKSNELQSQLKMATSHPHTLHAKIPLVPLDSVIIDLENATVLGKLGDIRDEAKPITYPMIVEFSLIAAGLLYIMWKNIGVEPEECDHDGAKFSTDNTIVAAVLGILTLGTSVVVMVIFIIYPDDITMYQSLLIGLYSACLISNIGVLVCVRKCHFDEAKAKTMGLDRGLLIISVMGEYGIGVFNLISGLMCTDNFTGNFTTVLAVHLILQCSVQVICLFDGLLREKGTSRRVGREFAFFSMACNVCLWLCSIIEVKFPQTDPLSLGFYHEVGWCIVSHVCMPLVILFRFHSAACFFDIWKVAWTPETSGQFDEARNALI